MPDTTTYVGSCHCGAVKFEVTTALKQVMSCNCSICSRTGALMIFVPAAQFKLLADGPQTDYQFKKKHIHHLFCATCGVRTFASGAARNGDEMRAINVRCLEGVDIDALEVKRFDGRSL